MFYVPKYNGRTFPFYLSSEQRKGRLIIAYRIEYAVQKFVSEKWRYRCGGGVLVYQGKY